MSIPFTKIGHSLITKVILTSGIALLVCMTAWSAFNLQFHTKALTNNVISQTDRLSTTIRLGTHYAMMLDSKDDIQQIVQNISRQPEIRAIRIYNKEGTVKFSNKDKELETETPITQQECATCHGQPAPPSMLPLTQRTRKFKGPDGYPRLGIITPIPNEPACWQDACHAHKETDIVLGLIDLEVSLEHTEAQLTDFKITTLLLSGLTFLVTFAALLFFIYRFVKRPIQALIKGTERIASGGLGEVDIQQEDEMGKLAKAVNEMGMEVFAKHSALYQQRNEYQTLFEGVPCLITVQDKDFKLLSYNQQFADIFAPKTGDYCYKAYKNRETPCDNCPVLKTFADGQSHISEEEGVNKDGTPAYWLVTTSPIFNEKGEIVAAMEMCLDITRRRKLEEDLLRSEQKYHSIFSNIPNPVFVLEPETLIIRDVNAPVEQVYGHSENALLGSSFLELFISEERDYYKNTLAAGSVINRVRQQKKNGETFFVEMRLSPTEYAGKTMLLVTTGDITKRLEAEQQLIQASKMATLGEMATGVAHELNQPLSVIKTASSFFIKKIQRAEPIEESILGTLAHEIDSHVDRAAKIINHLREFGRKPEMGLEPIDLNSTLQRSHDMFSQQLTLRQIQTIWNLEQDLPPVMGDQGKLEQVFINLLINARDAINDRWGDEIASAPQNERTITFTTRSTTDNIVMEISDTGAGIPSRLADRIFEPFFTTKRVGKGTGLGLSISYGIIQDCGGTIRACTDDSAGARFVIHFPRISETE